MFLTAIPPLLLVQFGARLAEEKVRDDVQSDALGAGDALKSTLFTSIHPLLLVQLGARLAEKKAHNDIQSGSSTAGGVHLKLLVIIHISTQNSCT